MSVFGNARTVRLAIRFFNRLDEKDKITIVSDLNPRTFKLRQHAARLSPLLVGIQNAMPEKTGIEIGNELLELGLDETYARLFVANMIKQAPTEDYMLSCLAKMADSEFVKILPEIMTAFWEERVSSALIVKRFKITREQFTCISKITGTNMNRLSRGTMTIARLQAKFKKTLSKQKSDVLLEQILRHKENWYASLVFANTQDVLRKANEISAQNKEILGTLQDLTRLLGGAREGSGAAGAPAGPSRSAPRSARATAGKSSR